MHEERRRFKDKISSRDKNVPPALGGCWYCMGIDGEMAFSCEFDCFLHLECLKNAIKGDPSDKEAQILKRELLSKHIDYLNKAWGECRQQGYKGVGWYFLDETGAFYHGPYKNYDNANEALKIYATELNLERVQ